MNHKIKITTTIQQGKTFIGFTKKIRPIINISIAGLLFAFDFGILYFSKYLYLFVISTVICTLGEIMLTVNSSVLLLITLL